jgi:hypothetical protein
VHFFEKNIDGPLQICAGTMMGYLRTISEEARALNKKRTSDELAVQFDLEKALKRRKAAKAKLRQLSPGRPRGRRVVLQQGPCRLAANRDAVDTSLLVKRNGEVVVKLKVFGPRLRYKDWFLELRAQQIVDNVLLHRSIKLGVAATINQDRRTFEDQLRLETVRGWFTRDPITNELVLKQRVQMKLDGIKDFIAQRAKVRGALAGFPNVVESLKETMRGLRAAGAPISSPIARPIFRGMMQHLAPQVFDREFSGGHHRQGVTTKFDVSRSFVKNFLRVELNWSWRVTTTAAQKLKVGWEEQWEDFILRLAYAADFYKIPQALTVNSDQTAMFLVPTNGARTMAPRNSKDVSVIGSEDKRNFTAVPSGAADGTLLPCQMVYGGTTSRSLPSRELRDEATARGWEVTNTNNHWSNLDTMKSIVESIIAPYFRNTITTLGLPEHQRCIWILDCWSVHRSVAFLEWMTDNFLWIIVIFVPGGLTGKAQWCDVWFQRPWKHLVTSKFNAWVCNQTLRQMAAGVDPVNIRVDLKIGPLRDLSLKWAMEAWDDLSVQRAQMLTGWVQCRVASAWDQVVRDKAKDVQAATQRLFAAGWAQPDGVAFAPEAQPVAAADVVHDDMGAELEDVVDAAGAGDPEVGVSDDEDAPAPDANDLPDGEDAPAPDANDLDVEEQVSPAWHWMTCEKPGCGKWRRMKNKFRARPGARSLFTCVTAGNYHDGDCDCYLDVATAAQCNCPNRR